MDEDKEIQVIDEQLTPPEGVVVASNGAWRDAKTGRFVPGGPATSNAITEVNSAEYQRRWQQKKAEGMLLADGRLHEVSVDYWGDLAEAMYNLGNKVKGGVAAVQATKMVGQMTGYLADSGSDSSPAAGTVRLEFGPEVIQAAIERITSKRDE